MKYLIGAMMILAGASPAFAGSVACSTGDGFELRLAVDGAEERTLTAMIRVGGQSSNFSEVYSGRISNAEYASGRYTVMARNQETLDIAQGSLNAVLISAVKNGEKTFVQIAHKGNVYYGKCELN